MKNLFWIFISALMLSCATPISPTGGARDQNPPKLLEVFPADQSVNTKPKEIIFQFDDYVNRPSFRQSVSIQPAFDLKVNYSFRKRSATIEIEGELSDSTTYVVILDKTLSDMKSNKLKEPIKFAFSTGPEIDNSFVKGKLLYQDGSIPEFGSVFLLEDGALRVSYVSQPDTGGNVTYQNVRAQDFHAIWFQDRNRNFRLDGEEDHISTELFQTQRDSTFDFGVIILPIEEKSQILNSVGLLSDQRLRLSFSNSEMAIPDSIGLVFKETTQFAKMLYREPSSKEIAYYWMAERLQDQTSYFIQLDTNKVINNADTIAVDAFADTTRQRLIEVLNGKQTLFNEALRFAFSKPISNSAILDSVILINGTEQYSGSEIASVKHNILSVIPMEEEWQEGGSYEVRVWSPEDGKWAKHKPIIILDKDLSSFWMKTEQKSHVSIWDAQKKQIFKEVVTDSLYLDKLNAGSYTLFAFVDEDSNGVWRNRTLQEDAEPYFFLPNFALPKGFETEIVFEFKR